jgi:hypothetical protein
MTQDKKKKTEAREFWLDSHHSDPGNLIFISEFNTGGTHVIEYSAYQKLREENEALRKALEFYASVESWNGSTYQYRARIDSTDESKVQGFDQHINFGGKRAREVLAKYPRGEK